MQGYSEVPCCKCGGLVDEFSISNEAWNVIVRKGGPETDREYLCVDCFAGIAADAIERLQKLVIHVRTEHWEEVRAVAGVQGAESLDDTGLLQACANWVAETRQLLKDWQPEP